MGCNFKLLGQIVACCMDDCYDCPLMAICDTNKLSCEENWSLFFQAKVKENGLKAWNWLRKPEGYNIEI